MANYEAPLLQGTISTSFKTAGALWSTGTRRVQLYEAEFGQTGSLSDLYWHYGIDANAIVAAAQAIAPGRPIRHLRALG